MNTRVHISLEVNDLDASIQFYRQLFQREPTKIKPFYANFRMEEPALHLALMHKPGRAPEPTDGSRHFGIELFADDRLSGWLEAVQKADMSPRIEEQVTCCYAVANKFWVQDPDGHEWEFWVRKGESDHLIDEGAEACCAPNLTEAALTAANPVTEETSTKVSCCAPSVGASNQVTEEASTKAACCAPSNASKGIQEGAKASACCAPTEVQFGKRA